MNRRRPLVRTSAAPVTVAVAVAVLASVAAAPAGRADEARDPRTLPPKDLDGFFPFEVPDSAADWQQRAAAVRLQMRVALGLHPEPERTPLNAVVHGEVDRGDYTVAKVYFESLPGFYVTGNLYRPKTAGGGAVTKRPGVLCPHGHWNNGRFYDNGEANTKAQVERGEEQSVESGRSPLQARSVGLARLGCVAFHYDMIGYADSTQLSYHLAHRHAQARPAMDTREGWGLYSAQAEAHLQSVMGLQTWNSIRALDFLESLPDVDPERLAVTGGSGGGTQSMILAALDPRVAVSFPAVMVSTAMQGGCTCENASLLRVGTGNVEFAALFAPRPQGLSTADDWTREFSTKGFPQLKQLYALLGAPDNVMLHDRTEFKHNYNLPTRLAMYRWFNKHLDLGHEGAIKEREYQRLTPDEMTVWNSDHPRPEGGDGFERQLLQTWRKASTPDPQQSRTGLRTIFRRDLASAGATEFSHDKTDHGDHLEMSGTITNTTHGEKVTTTFLYPKNWRDTATLWLHPDGRSSLTGDDGKPIPQVQQLLDAGHAVAAIDPLRAGAELAPKVANPREFAGYTLGYNDALAVQRTHDALTTLRFILDDDHGAEKVNLIAHPGTTVIGAATRMLAGDSLHRAAIHDDGTRIRNLLNYRHPDFIPGAAKYGDVEMMLELGKSAALAFGEGRHAPETRWLIEARRGSE